MTMRSVWPGFRDRFRAVGTFVVIAIVIAGCDSASSAFPRRCPSRSDIAKIVGVEVSSGVETSGGSGPAFTIRAKGCRYETVPAPGGPPGTVRIGQLTSDDKDLFGRLTAPRAAEAGKRPFEPVDGLGFEARLDGEELVVRTPDAIVFVEVSQALRATIDVGPATIEMFKAIAPMSPGLARPADCDAWAGPVVGVLGPLGRSIPPAPRESDRSVGTVDLPVHGCRFDLASGSVVNVRVADPARWPAWVAAKERSQARTRYVEREVAGRRAVQLANTLFVADGSAVIEVETQDVAGSDSEMDQIREALATLVL